MGIIFFFFLINQLEKVLAWRAYHERAETDLGQGTRRAASSLAGGGARRRRQKTESFSEVWAGRALPLRICYGGVFGVLVCRFLA